MNELEELFFEDGVELELIEKSFRAGCQIPLVRINSNCARFYFNTAAATYIPSVIKWFTTSDYVIGLPTTDKDPNGYKTWNCRNVNAICASFPAGLMKIKKLKNGIYKIFKYKDGIAFKRYEPFDFGSLNNN